MIICIMIDDIIIYKMNNLEKMLDNEYYKLCLEISNCNIIISQIYNELDELKSISTLDNNEELIKQRIHEKLLKTLRKTEETYKECTEQQKHYS